MLHDNLPYESIKVYKFTFKEELQKTGFMLIHISSEIFKFPLSQSYKKYIKVTK